MKNICVVVSSRANYSSIKSAMRAIRDNPQLELNLVVSASAVLDRYGSVVNLIESDGFEPVARLHMLVEGETPATMAKSTGLGLIELPTVFERIQPDVVVTVGDRFETMATTLAAAYMNIPIAHTMGGEVSGTIDESIRHAVTKFAHLHFPASPDAQNRIVRLGEDPATVHLVGCPRIDLVSEILRANDEVPAEALATGVGDYFDPSEPFILVSQHPVTTEYGHGEEQITATLESVQKAGLPAAVLWPNADAGADDIARGIRKWREQDRDGGMRFFKNLPIEVYVRLMSRASCLVGNSSSGIREGAYIGTPVVDIGSRQEGRERGHNVVSAPHQVDAIHEAIMQQIEHGRYSSDATYGDGHAGERIGHILEQTSHVNVQKRICY